MDLGHSSNSNSQPSSSQSLTGEYHEFSSIKYIGHGGYGHVYLAQKMNGKDVNEYYALKEITAPAADGESINSISSIRRREEEIKNERKVLELVQGFHFCIQMFYAFKIQDKYFLALEYYQRGDLKDQLSKQQHMEYNTARLCAAEILLALEFLHSKNIVYRDLKPENILVDRLGHLVLTDFGLAVQLAENGAVLGCSGTYVYMAPEAIRVSPQGFRHAVDFWSLGCVLYEMLTGRVPFEEDEHADEDHAQQFLQWRILYEEPCFEYQHFRDHRIARRFLEQLLDKTPNQRLGAGQEGIRDIKTHPFFNDINWKYVYYKKYTLLGEMVDTEPVAHFQRNVFRKRFIRNGYDFVADHLRYNAPPDTLTSRYEKIRLPNEQPFDALYDEDPQTAVYVHSKKYDLHLTVPKQNAEAALECWMRGCIGVNNNIEHV